MNNYVELREKLTQRGLSDRKQAELKVAYYKEQDKAVKELYKRNKKTLTELKKTAVGRFPNTSYLVVGYIHDLDLNGFVTSDIIKLLKKVVSKSASLSLFDCGRIAIAEHKFDGEKLFNDYDEYEEEEEYDI